MYSKYDRFAWIYNRHWGSDFTEEALDVLSKLVLKRIPARSNVLDLCCGTGQLASELSTRGYSVTGVDGSAQMLRFARKNALKCRFLQADATRFRTTERFDLVVSTYDSLNHVMKLGQLREVFRRVFDALKDGGLFLFDLNMDEGFKTRWRGSYAIVEADHVCAIRLSYDSVRRTGRFRITMFFRKRRAWARSNLTLEERCYEASEVVQSLMVAGFTKVRSLDSKRNLKLREVGRTFFLAEKPSRFSGVIGRATENL